MTGELAPGASLALPAPTSEQLACEVCSETVHYLRFTTPPGLPDFIRSLGESAWIGWSWSEEHQALSLVATCSRACLGEWWLNQTEPGM